MKRRVCFCSSYEWHNRFLTPTLVHTRLVVNVFFQIMRKAAAQAVAAAAAKAASRSLDTTDDATTLASLSAMIEEVSASSASLNAELDTQWVM